MNETESPIGALYIYDIASDGTAKRYETNDPPPTPESLSYRWVHLDLRREQARSWIEERLGSVAAEALTVEDTRPRFSKLDEGFLVILRGVNLNPAADPEDMVSIRLWISDRLIISVRLRRLAAVVALRESLDSGTGPRTAGAFIADLAEGLTERMSPVIDGMADEAAALEERSLGDADGLRAVLSEMRRTIIILRRYIGPQRDALARLVSEAGEILRNEDRLKLRETIDRITRLIEEMDAMRERFGVLNDQLADQRAEEMNRNTMILSVVAAIFLPLGFLTGLLGVNVGGIPGVDSPYAFAILCVAMLVLGAAITLFFKKLKWI